MSLATILAMMDPAELSDDALLAEAHAWRRKALYGNRHARDHANALEGEQRRRFMKTEVDSFFRRPTPSSEHPFSP